MLEYTILSAHNVDVCKFGGDEDERYLAFFEFKLEKKEESSYGGPLVFLMSEELKTILPRHSWALSERGGNWSS